MRQKASDAASYACPACGSLARLPSHMGKLPTCARCGGSVPSSPVRLGRPGANIRNLTPIRHGMKAEIAGKTYYATGLIRHEQKEDDGVSSWLEWVLVSPEGDEKFLEYDGGRWKMTEPFEPANADEIRNAPNANAGHPFQIEGRRAIVSESATSRVVAAEGEVPWPVRVGVQTRYADLQALDGTLYSAEREPDYDVEWFRGRALKDRDVFAMFGLNDLLAAYDRRAGVKRGRRLFGLTLVALSILAFILYGVAGGRGRQVAQGTVSAAQVDEVNGSRFGPYRLDKVNRVYRLRISSQLSATSMWVQGVVEGAETGPFFDVDSEFWDESGSDSDGYWHEWVLESHREFRLDAPREVYVRLFADPEAAAANAPISWALEEGVVFPTPFLPFGIIGMILGFSWLIASAESAGGKVWEGMAEVKPGSKGASKPQKPQKPKPTGAAKPKEGGR